MRKNDSAAKIAILEDEKHLLYSRVFLPRFAMGEIGLDKVMLRTLNDYEKNNIDIFLSERVVKIDFEKKTADTDSGKNFSYKKLLIASGGRAEEWQFSDGIKDKVYRLQTLDDALGLKSLFEQKPHGKVLVVGGGLITLEFLNIFSKYGWEITLLMRERFFWNGLVEERGGELFNKIFLRGKINVIAGDEVHAIKAEENILAVRTKGSKILHADAIAVGVGLKRNLEFARGLSTASGIKVDNYLKAGDGVWAAGDVAEYVDPFSGKSKTIGNWTHAFLTGRIAGINMAGSPAKAGDEEFRSTASYSTEVLGAVITIIGEIALPEAETFVSLDEVSDKYSRFFLKNGRLIGAFLVNSQQIKPFAAKLIESEKNVSGRENLLFYESGLKELLRDDT